MTWDEKEDTTIYKVERGTRARLEPRPNAWST